MKITKAEFITSAAAKEQFIKSDKPVIAVSGKSNVGKSSFINMLANRKKLAKVSKDPGRTRLINYFDFGDFILADLPGYGYARVSKEEKRRWGILLDAFFADGANVDHVFALADIRHQPTADDKQMINFLYYKNVPFTLIATKADKISRAALNKNIASIAAELRCGPANIIATSAHNRYGLEAVLERTENIINAVKSASGGEDA